MNNAQLAEDSLRQFVVTLQKLLIAEKRQFDFVLGAGNSGQIMVWISRVVFNILNIPFPPSVVFPIYRYKDFPRKKLFDNSAVIDQFSSLQIPQKVKNVLFVDDETDRGNSVDASMRIFEQLNKDHPTLSYTIIAEEGEVKPEFNSSKVEYISPKKRASEIYSAIAQLIPAQYKDPIQKVLETKMKTVNNKKIMCILLGLPIKEPNNGNPQFNFKFEKMVNEELPNLVDLQKNYQTYLTDKVITQLTLDN